MAPASLLGASADTCSLWLVFTRHCGREVGDLSRVQGKDRLLLVLGCCSRRGDVARAVHHVHGRVACACQGVELLGVVVPVVSVSVRVQFQLLGQFLLGHHDPLIVGAALILSDVSWQMLLEIDDLCHVLHTLADALSGQHGVLLAFVSLVVYWLLILRSGALDHGKVELRFIGCINAPCFLVVGLQLLLPHRVVSNSL